MNLFAHPDALLQMLLAAVLTAAFLLYCRGRKQNALALWIHPRVLQRLADAGLLQRQRWKLAFSLGALAMFFLALAGPQWGVNLVQSQASGTHVIIAVDTSLSMQARDFKPNRMEKAKTLLSNLIDQLPGNRVGILVFSGEPHIQCPLTHDAAAAKMFLNAIRAGMVPQPGTAVGKTIRFAAEILARYPGQKALVLLTDGEDHRTQPLEAAEAAAAEGIHIYPIGIGTAEGEPIPMLDGAGNLLGYKKNKKGETVVSKLAEGDLTKIAEASQGAYYRASDSESEVEEISRAIAQLDKSKFQERSLQRYKNRYQFPLFLGVLFLLIEMLIPETRKSIPLFARLPPPLGRKTAPPAGSKIPGAGGGNGLPRRAGTLVLALLFLPSAALRARAESSKRLINEGNKAYHGEKYEQALELFDKALQKKGVSETAQFNRAAALYKMAEYEQAQAGLEKILPSKKLRDKKDVHYNLGNALYRLERYQDAAEQYKQAIRLSPGRAEDAKHNLALALRRLKMDPNQKKNKDDKSKNRRKKDQKQDKDGNNKDQKGGMSREDAQIILQRLREKEKEKSAGDPDRMNRIRQDPSQSSQTEEDW